MILDALFGRFGKPRMIIMWLFTALSLLGLSVMIGGGYDSWKEGFSTFFKTGIWINIIIGVLQFLPLLLRWREAKIEPIAAAPPIAEAVPVEPVINMESGQYEDSPFTFSGNPSMIWDSEEKPIPLDKILHHKKEFTYNRLYNQKRIYEKMGNSEAARMIQTLWQPYLHNQYWKSHKSRVKNVPLSELKIWEP